jgi:hypothetical protein
LYFSEDIVKISISSTATKEKRPTKDLLQALKASIETKK